MKKKQGTIAAFSLMILALGISPLSIYAEVVTESASTEEQTATTLEETKSSQPETVSEVEETTNDETIVPELQKALDAGFTKEQYDQIMQMPKVPAAEDRSTLTRATLTEKQSKVVSKAKEQIGKPYVWGAQGPNSFDCGGLVRYVYKQAVGMDVPMGTTNQEKMGTEVSLNALQPGDLVFYGNRGATYHVAIYIGNGQILHAPQPNETVCIIDMKWFPPQFARRLLAGDPEPPKKQTVVTEVSKTVMVNNVWKSIDSLPWGMKGYARVAASSDYTGKVVSVTQETADYSYSPELKGWIDKKGLVEVIKTNSKGTIKNAGYSIDQMPWHSGVKKLGVTGDHVNESVTVTARTTSGYYYVANLGWIDFKAFNPELQQAVNATPNTNTTSSTKRTITEMDTTASVIGNGKSIDTLPWGIKGYSRLGSLNDHAGKTVKITQDWGAYVYSPDLKGWVDKKGLNIK